MKRNQKSYYFCLW